MKKHIIVFFLVAFFSSLIYVLISADRDDRIVEILKDESKYLDISYKQGLDRFHVIAETVYISLQNDKKFVDIFANVKKDGIDKTHDKMLAYLSDEFVRLQQLGFMGLQIILPNNTSLLRMHKVDKYGDDLTSVRYSLDYVNKHKTHMHGFEEGRTSHAFREVYPIFKDGEYLGIVEVLFSSTKLQDYTMRASDIHTHFIVDKNVFDANAWDSDLVRPYKQSIEHSDYLFSNSDHMQHKRLGLSNKTIITPLRQEIDEGVKSEEAFEVYQKVGDAIKVVAFIPVKRIKDEKVVAYLVSYTESDKILEILDRYNFLVILLVVLSLLTYLVVTLIIRDKSRMLNELKYDLLTNVLNRKYFTQHLDNVVSILQRSDTNFSIVMADIDFFKNVNDTYGHQYGDVVLSEFAGILKESIRSADKVARYGGEEFILLLVTDKDNAFKVIENIRKKIKEHPFGDAKISLRASFGIAQGGKEESVAATIKRADEALYVAKENGRDQTQVC